MADVRIKIVGRDESKGAISSARGGLSGLAGDAGRAESAFGGLNVKLLNLNAAIGVVSALKGVLSGLAGALQKPFEAVAGYERMAASIQALTAREIRAGDATLSMADAMKQAAIQSQETLRWIQKIAIESPFDRQGVADAYKTALAYGFTGKQAQGLTEELIDFAAATGQSSAVLNQLAYPLGQIRAGTQVYTQDLRQLMTVGVPVQDILKEMGFSLEDVGKGLVKSDKFLAQFSKTLRRDFGGAAKAQAGTFAGLVSSLEDISDIAMRNLFTPMFERAQPILNNIVEQLQMPGVARALGMVGTAVGNLIAGPLRGIESIFKGAGRAFEVFDNAIAKGIKPIYAVRLALQTFLPPSLMPAINGIIRGVVAFTDAMEIANDPIAAFKKALEALQLPTGLEKIGKITVDVIGDVLQGDLVGAFGRVDDWLAAAKSFVDNVIDPALVGVLTGIWQGITPQIDVAVAEIVKAIDNAIGAKAAPDISARMAQELRDQAKYGLQEITKGDVAWATLGVRIGTKIEEWGEQILSAVKRLALRVWVDFQQAWATLGVRIGTKIEEWGEQILPAVERLALRVWVDFQQALDSYFVQGKGGSIQPRILPLQDMFTVPTWGPGHPYYDLGTAISEMWSQGPTNWLIGKIKEGLNLDPLLLQSDGEAIGKNLGGGIKTGLEGQGAAIGEGGKTAVEAAMSAIRAAYGIASPSTWTRDNIGVPLAEGIAAGLTAGVAGIEAALRFAILGPMTRIAAEALQMARSIGSAMGVMGTPAGMGAPATVIVPTTIQALPKFGGISPVAAMPLDLLQQARDAVSKYIGGSPVVDLPAGVYAAPAFKGISSAAERPLDIFSSITTAVKSYLGGSPIIDIVAKIYAAINVSGVSPTAQKPLDIFRDLKDAVLKHIGGVPSVDAQVDVYALPSIAGVSQQSLMPLDIFSALINLAKSHIGGEPSLDVIVKTYAFPIVSGMSRVATKPLDLMLQLTDVIKYGVGIPSYDNLVKVYALPVVSGVSASSAKPLDLMQQLTDAVRKYIGGVPVVSIPVRVQPSTYAGPSPEDLDRYGRAGGGPVSAMRPYIVGERGPEWFVPKQSGTVVPNGGETTVNLSLDGAVVARLVMDRMTGMVYEDSRRYG